jgi:hypothetical protein
MLERRDAITNKVLETITFVLANPTVSFFFQQLTIQRTIGSMFRPTATIKGKVKIKQSRYRPGVAQRVPGSFPDYMTTAQDGGKIVSLTHRPALPPGNAPGTHFC